MRLIQLVLKNFRPYYGEVALDFPDAREGEVFLVHGRNGFGKTSMHMAVQWALYGEGTRRELYDHANYKALREAGFVMSVSLVFTHEDRSYRLVREGRANHEPVEAPEHLGRSQFSLYRDGQPLPTGESDVAQERIEGIIPRDASQFFFFDGERIGTYSSSDRTDETRRAIELVLGLRAAQNARTDAASLKTEIRKQRNKIVERNEQQAELGAEQEGLTLEIQGLTTSHEEAVNSLQKLEETRQERRAQMEDMAEIQMLARELERLEEERARLTSEHGRVMDELGKESRGLYLRVVAPQILQAHDACFTEYERVRELETAQRLKQSIAEYLEKLASDAVCVCGRPLEDHARAMIKGAATSANQAAPDALADSREGGTEVAARLELLRRAKATAERAAQRFEELAIKKVDLDESLSGVESKIASLDNEMGSIDAESVNELRTLISRVEDEISLTERERLALELQIEARNEAADKLEHQIRKLGGVSGVGAALEAQIDLLDRTEKAFEEFLVRSARARRAQIEEQANHFFKKITIKTTGYESMFIADDFTFGINASDGTKPNMDQISEGEKHVVAFSFIMGLNRYAKSSAPLIIDTPMGRLEQEHRRNLAAAIAGLDQQVFLFVTDTDLAFGVREILGEAVEKEFEITHDQSTLTSTIQEMSS